MQTVFEQTLDFVTGKPGGHNQPFNLVCFRELIHAINQRLSVQIRVMTTATVATQNHSPTRSLTLTSRSKVSRQCLVSHIGSEPGGR